MTYTRKEIRIILLMAEGMSSIVIADMLGLSEDTIANQRRRILKKSECLNWCHFMAQHGKNGLLEEWAKDNPIDSQSNSGDQSPPSA
ncbi:MAG: helix-turn-helix transcriptional regulator [Flavobacteriales bacterium]|nr:helix-turn-helix transcriptional regulator [Flavobacteriales bacterium]